MRFRFTPTICLYLFVTTAYAGNLIHIADGEFKHQKNWPLDMWGIELENWRDIPAEPVEVQRMLQPLAVHGINTVGFVLHGGEAGAFFAPDGTCIDKKTAEQFSQTAINIRDHYLATVVSLFSADRRYRLESAEAYRAAVQTVARLLPSRHSCVLVVGDGFRKDPWPDDAPYPMNDPAKVIELCSLIEKRHEPAIVAIPGYALLKGKSKPVPLFASGENNGALTLIAEASRIGKAFLPSPVTEATSVYGCRFLTRDRLEGDPEEAMAKHLAYVRKTRLATARSAPEKASPQPDADGWIELFDGKTLDGWSTLQRDNAGWSVQDGAIHCAGINGTWLRSKEIYDAFVFQLECMIIKDGNSGVFLWSPLDARSSRFGMEMQIMGRYHAQPEDKDTTGAIYDVLPPRKDASLPAGQWNRIEITCRPSHVVMKVNGEVVQDFDPDKVDTLKHRLRRGFIGLQDHGDEVWFRHIRIRKLDNR